MNLTTYEELFLKCIKEGLKSDPKPIEDLMELDEDGFFYLFEEGSRQSLLPVLYEGIRATVFQKNSVKGNEDLRSEKKDWRSEKENLHQESVDSFHKGSLEVGKEILQRISTVERKKTLGMYHLFAEMNRAIQALQESGFSVCVLKGPTVGVFYPMVEYRKSGDIDLWLKDVDAFGEEFERAAAVLEGLGYKKDEKMDSIYHVGFYNSKGLEIELHIALTGEFSNRHLNEVMKGYTESLRKKDFSTVNVLTYEYPTLAKEDLIFYNLLHMLHHFTTKGFGWKFICDWSMMFQKKRSSNEEVALFHLLEEAHLLDFSEAVSLLAVEYMGLKKENVAFLLSGEISKEVVLHLAKELFEAGELGQMDKNRMLRPERGHVFSLCKLFHIQMKKNYPKASKVCLLWIVLWPATLIRFIKNNHTIRKVSTKEVLKEALNRGKTTESLHLYRR